MRTVEIDQELPVSSHGVKGFLRVKRNLGKAIRLKITRLS